MIIDDLIQSSLSQLEECDVHQLAAECVRLRMTRACECDPDEACRRAERLIAAEVEVVRLRAQLADRRVVVPDLTKKTAKDQVQVAINALIKDADDGMWTWSDLISWGYELCTASVRAVTPDEVVVKRKELDDLRKLAEIVSPRYKPMRQGEILENVREIDNRLDALRKGGE